MSFKDFCITLNKSIDKCSSIIGTPSLKLAIQCVLGTAFCNCTSCNTLYIDALTTLPSCSSSHRNSTVLCY